MHTSTFRESRGFRLGSRSNPAYLERYRGYSLKILPGSLITAILEMVLIRFFFQRFRVLPWRIEFGQL